MARHAYGMGLQVCLWHNADMLNALTNVRFWGQADSDQPLLTACAGGKLVMRLVIVKAVRGRHRGQCPLCTRVHGDA